MQSDLILWPALALAAQTFIVAMLMGASRFIGISRRQIDARYFRLNQGYEIPALPAQIANNYHNLLQLPVLFYALIAFLLVTGRADATFIWLAWAFVASRVVHSIIHIAYNYVPHRFAAFLLGVGILLAMWIRFALAL
ncbi:MAG: MAPEG family protein [Gammaproteobacteria bacterium]|jgi:hypothetical protein